ncbi:YphA family membrane protein [Anoxybacillus sp. J5B_2022]|uniref:YphA family membrane protein n=1 Tax=Anoxybacillus sp. J5B_2022 TaxID=3003246 RepID=UPI0022866553|nr:hypothetical protein [Anoxybacillus sp. J5B_2022]MCZ0754427.1 hypothetical protein [Anoxybacillus sp. J5B_2022]
MEGIYFYWCAWVVWIYATFLMKKTKWRTALAAGVLLLMSGSIYHVGIGVFSLTYSFLFLFVAAFALTANGGKQLGYLFMAALAVAFLSAAFRLLALADPVWVWADERWMLAISMAAICLMLHRDSATRLFAAIIGSCQGEIVYAVAVRDVFPYTIGSLPFFDALALTCACLFVWSLFENMHHHVDAWQKQMKRNKPL